MHGSRISAPRPINGVVFGDSLSSPASGVSLASTLQTLRPWDTWVYVSVAALMLESPSGGAIGPGANSWKTLVHDVYFVTGARNMTINWSILHGDCNDTFDTAETIIDRCISLTSQQRSYKWETMMLAVPATTEYNDPLGSPYRRPQRKDVNVLLRNGDATRAPRGGADKFADVCLIAGLGQEDVPISGVPGGTLVSSDGIHLTAAGQQACASVVNFTLG